jgi:23S rRNA (cytidine1920-2'-O)/16S rRNA (cytidine1409-2'-O)-methyltransferase
LLRPERREAVLLVKPQFEVGKERVGKGGVVRDPAAHVDAISGVIAAAAAEGWRACGVVASPITGPAGNHEYLLWLRSGAWQGEGELPHNDAMACHKETAGTPPDGEVIRRLVAATLA